MTIISVEDSRECYIAALRRMSIFINSKNGTPCRESWLRKSDEEIGELFDKKSLNPEFISYREISTLAENSSHLASDQDRANNDFYGRLGFIRPSGKKGVRVIFENTEFFRDNLVTGFSIPETINTKNLSSRSLSVLAKECLTNYLVKNFWHNGVHRLLQNINDSNFHNFRGDARYESDFTADNLGTIFLMKSYGVNCLTRGRSSTAYSRKIHSLIERNRCNRVFARRASVRNEDMSELEAFQERSWRFKRAVANLISVDLIQHGATVTDLAVYFSGRIHERNDSRVGFYNSGNVLVRLNGLYFDTEKPPYLEDHLDFSLSPERLTKVKQFRANRLSEIVIGARGKYIQELSRDISLREMAERNAEIIYHRVAKVY